LKPTLLNVRRKLSPILSFVIATQNHALDEAPDWGECGALDDALRPLSFAGFVLLGCNPELDRIVRPA
jgi:hypothetical protein